MMATGRRRQGVTARGCPKGCPQLADNAAPSSWRSWRSSRSWPPSPTEGGGGDCGDAWTRATTPTPLTPPDTPSTPGFTSFPAFSPSEPARSVGAERKYQPERLSERLANANAAAAKDAEGLAPSGWSLRSRRYRLSARPAKRLFTPEIKRLLKGWLVRRRDNPYPSRAEKEALATRTGLTYLQVCNWFANWRRKLRDCGRPDGGAEAEAGDEAASEGDSWAQLIRRYNALAAGPDAATAQERFSISSSDSIWASEEGTSRCLAGPQQNACVSSTSTEPESRSPHSDSTLSVGPGGAGGPASDPASISGAGRADSDVDVGEERRPSPEAFTLTPCATASGSALLLSKWLDSASRYQPGPPGLGPKVQGHRAAQPAQPGWAIAGFAGIASAAVEHTLEGRHREELDAAEALAFLSSLRFR